MIDLSRLDRPPAGFAACVECAYRDTGSAPICFACASEHTERIAPRSCDVCGQALPEVLPAKTRRREGPVRTVPVLGGLHHTDERAA